jgi:protein-tyrosine phosphatase
MTESIARGHVSLPGLSGTVWFGAVFLDDQERDELFAELDANDVSVVWNLQEYRDSYEDERAHFKAVVWTPIPDYGAPEDRQVFVRDLDRVIALLRQGINVYVHCAAGHGRTGMALAAMLVRLGVPSRQALSQVQQAIGGPEVDEQEQFVETIEPAA